jgi:hypothetical protein
MGEEERLQHWNRSLGFKCLTTWEEAHGPPPYNYGLSIYGRNKDITQYNWVTLLLEFLEII